MVMEPPFSELPVAEPVSGVKRGRGRPRKDAPVNGDVAPKNMKSGSKPSWVGSAAIEETLKTGWENFIVAPMMFIEPYDAQILAEHGPLVIHELVELAIIDRKYRKILEMLAKPGKYGGILIATSGMVLPILSHHGVNPMENLLKGLFTSKISDTVSAEQTEDGLGGEQ